MPTRCFCTPDRRGKCVAFVDQADFLQQRFGFRTHLGARAVLHVHRRLHQVLQYGHVRPQREVLEETVQNLGVLRSAAR